VAQLLPQRQTAPEYLHSSISMHRFIGLGFLFQTVPIRNGMGTEKAELSESEDREYACLGTLLLQLLQRRLTALEYLVHQLGREHL
jgi:hypothetical protein